MSVGVNYRVIRVVAPLVYLSVQLFVAPVPGRYSLVPGRGPLEELNARVTHRHFIQVFVQLGSLIPGYALYPVCRDALL